MLSEGSRAVQVRPISSVALRAVLTEANLYPVSRRRKANFSVWKNSKNLNASTNWARSPKGDSVDEEENRSNRTQTIVTTETFSVSYTLKKGKLPSLPFKRIKEYVLGKDFDINLVFVGDRASRTLNRQFRNKDKTSNVLSFPLSSNGGDIFINLRQAERECDSFNMKRDEFVAYLFIHGLLHLKGMEHGSRMEKEEQRILDKFKL